MLANAVLPREQTRLHLEQLLQRFGRLPKIWKREHHGEGRQQSNNADRRHGQEIGTGQNRKNLIRDSGLPKYPAIHRVEYQTFSPPVGITHYCLHHGCSDLCWGI
jgi:hypothetical protein